RRPCCCSTSSHPSCCLRVIAFASVPRIALISVTSYCVSSLAMSLLVLQSAWIHLCDSGVTAWKNRKCPPELEESSLLRVLIPPARKAPHRCNYYTTPQRCPHPLMTRISCRPPAWSRSCAWPMTPTCRH